MECIQSSTKKSTSDYFSQLDLHGKYRVLVTLLCWKAADILSFRSMQKSTFMDSLTKFVHVPVALLNRSENCHLWSFLYALCVKYTGSQQLGVTDKQRDSLLYRILDVLICVDSKAQGAREYKTKKQILFLPNVPSSLPVLIEECLRQYIRTGPSFKKGCSRILVSNGNLSNGIDPPFNMVLYVLLETLRVGVMADLVWSYLGSFDLSGITLSNEGAITEKCVFGVWKSEYKGTEITSLPLPLQVDPLDSKCIQAIRTNGTRSDCKAHHLCRLVKEIRDSDPANFLKRKVNKRPRPDSHHQAKPGKKPRRPLMHASGVRISIPTFGGREDARMATWLALQSQNR